MQTNQTLKAWWIWFIATAFVVYQFGIQTSYSVLNNAVQADLHLSLVEIGNIAAFYMWFFALAQLFGGPLLDVLGARKVLLPAIGLVTLGTIIFGQATNYTLLLLAECILALGSCVAFVGAGYVGGKWFGMAKFAIMFGFVQVASALFAAFGQGLVNIGLESYSWRQLTYFGTLYGVILFALAWFWLKDPLPIHTETKEASFFKNVIASLVQALKIPALWNCMLWGAIVLGCQLALGIVWAPKLLNTRGISLFDANAAATLLWLGVAVGCLVLPSLSERLCSRRMPALSGVLLQILSLLALIYLPITLTSGMFLCFLFGIGNSVHMLAFASAGDVVPLKYVGAAAALVNGAMFILGGILISLPSYIFKVMGDTPEALQNAFLIYVLLLGVAGGLIALMREPHPKAKTSRKMKQASDILR